MCALQSDRPKAVGGVGEQELYTGIEMMWISYLEHLARFSSYNTVYTQQMGDDMLLAVESARQLPGEAQRTEMHASLNKELAPLGEDCAIIWKQMESFILRGFSELVVDEKLNAAGYQYYAGAARGDWEDVLGLMQAGLNFITANTADLTTGGMPATFEAEFEAAKDVFSAKHNKFLQAEETAKVLRDEKITVNNKLYTETMPMGNDGKKIFRNEPAIRDQFTWDTVQSLISSAAAKHSVKGLVLALANDEPIPEALVRVFSTSETPVLMGEATTNEVGEYKIIGLKNGTYRMTVEKTGYVTYDELFTIEGGALELNVGLVGSE